MASRAPLSPIAIPSSLAASARELFSLAGVKLNLTSAFHPQSDGQAEVMNKIISMYLHCLTSDHP
jgi:hypothetical protein